MRLSADEQLALSLQKIQLENPALVYVRPHTAAYYEERFPGLPPEVFAILEEMGPREPQNVSSPMQTTEEA